MKRFLWLALLAAAAKAQQMTALEANQLCARAAELVDATGLAIPELRRAGAPVAEIAMQSCAQLRLRPAAGQASYSVLNSLRAFLDISDAVPKPYPLPEIVRDQLREIRDAATRFEAHFRALLDRKDADLRAPDRDGALRYTEENRLLPPPKANRRRVVFLGDSTISQWRLNQYFPDEDYINRGIDEQLTGQLLTRMKSDVIDLKPAAVVIQGGAFDLAREVPIELIADNVQLIADVAAANNIKVVIASLLPGNDRAGALNDWLKAFALQRKLVYVDFQAALGGIADATDEGVPNSKGYRLMAPVLAKAVDQALKPTPSPAPVKPPAQTKTAPPKR